MTKHFHDRGWRGANVEPIKRKYELFRSARPDDLNLNVAVGRTGGQRQFFECVEVDALSTFDPRQADFLKASGYSIESCPIETVTATHIFEELDAEVVDFLKIDVEGLESEVVQSLDWARFRPKVVLIEATSPARGFPGWSRFDTVAAWASWEPTVLRSGYQFVHFDGLNRFYVREEDRELATVFRLPVGYFDAVHFPVEEELRDEGAELGRQLAGAVARSEELKHRLQQVEKEAGRQLARAVAQRDDLSDKLERVEAERREAVRRLDALEARGLRERIREVGRYAVKRAKDRLLPWRLPTGGKSLPPPRISLVTPVTNAAGTIAETLESVLNQDYTDLEYIIVDGGSTDGTLDIIRSYMARRDLPQRIAVLISEADGGMYDALGKGFARSTGEVLGYLNADDLLEAGGLAAVGTYLRERPGVDLVFHEDTVLVDGWKYPNARQPSRITTIDLLRGHILFQDGVFFRRRLYDSVGGVRRDLRYAGDYDLWLRMSARTRFVRRPNHVSCFRIRPGQLSSDMNGYRREMERSRADFLARAGRIRKLRWRLARRGTGAAPRRLDRLFFPIDFGNMPPPSAIAPRSRRASPRSPIDGQPAERLLFSAMDTRFGERELNYVYLDARHGIAVTHPPVDSDTLDALYRKHYSSPPTQIKVPDGASPYRQFNRMSLWDRALLLLPVDRIGCLFPRAWADNTLAELKTVLRGARFDVARPLHFLDAGCFEGQLLDEIRRQTPWMAYGLEPNEAAVAVARGKGHEVWLGHADRAPELVSPGMHFDVVFMGQSLEHVDDPVLVLRRLRMLLAPGGALVVSTPNLDSRQIDWFGPTWAHWHPPYHRYIFSRKGLIALARQAGLYAKRLQTFSHPYWTAMSLAQNWLGLGGAVSHAVQFDRSTCTRAWRIDFWAKVFWNRVGRGDYCFLVMTDEEGA